MQGFHQVDYCHQSLNALLPPGVSQAKQKDKFAVVRDHESYWWFSLVVFF